MSLSLIVGLVLTALLYAVALILWRRKGLRTMRWYITAGICIVVLIGWALIGFFGIIPQGITAIIAIIAASPALISALRWHPTKNSG